MTGPEERDSGSTLVETLVTAVLVVVVLAIATTALTSGQRTARETVGRVQSADTARVAVAELSRTLRTAVRPGPGTTAAPTLAVEVAQADRLVLFAHDRPVPPAPAGTGPTRTEYRIDAVAGTLVETRWAAPASAWDAGLATYAYTAAPVTRVLARGLTLPQPAVFTYHESVDPACVRTTGCIPAALALTGTALSAADRARVRAVSIALSVRTPEVRSGSRTALRTFVVLPNGEEAVTP